MHTRRHLLSAGAALGTLGLATPVLAGRNNDASNGGGGSTLTNPMTDSTSESTAFLSAGELAGLVADKAVSAEELTRFYIERIERTHEALNAVVVQDFERALEAARACDAAQAKGELRGPLHGVPITVKESYDVAGLKTTWGNPAWRDMTATDDAAVVARLKTAGAVLLGKTNVPLMLGDYQSYNAIYGQTNNPWDTSRGPGGSSGGSAAALAAGLTGMEAGSDIGGSLRNPAHFCGIYAHKPTWGVVPIAGHQPPPVTVSNGADIAVVGPMARSIDDLEMAMGLLTGPMPLQARGWRVDLPPPRARQLKGLRVAIWADEPSAPVSEAVRGRVEALAQLLEKQGAVVMRDARPAIDLDQAMFTYLSLMQAVNTSGVPDEVFAINQKAAQGFAVDDMTVPAMFARAAVQTHNEWVRHDGARHRLRGAWNAFFADVDVLLCPISTTTAFAHDHSEPSGARMLDVDGTPRPYFDGSFWAGMISVAGLPSTVFPTGLASDGLPIGLQAVSAEFDDYTCIEFARLMREELGGFTPPPAFV